MSPRSLMLLALRTINEPPARPGRRLLLYYGALAATAGAFIAAVPGATELLTGDRLASMAAEGGGLLLGQPAAPPPATLAWRFDLQLFAVMLGALALMVPTAWVYTSTRRTRGFDQGVVQTLLILPIAVAGIVMVVQNSLALAFSLAGVVAAVRFRSTLKDTSDMLYIFVAIAAGIAAGVHALTAAAVLTGTFNLVTLAIWQCGVDQCPLSGQEHSHAAAGKPPQAGPPSPAANGAPVDRPRKKKRRFDAILSVQTANPAPARLVVEEVLAAEARRWQIDEITPKKSGRTVLKYVVRLEAGKQPEAVLDLLLARGAPHVLGASLR
jgi:hypothetical protein